jgi:predicted transposase YdaD
MAKGREEGKLEMAAKLKRQGLLSAEQIASISGLSEEQVADI